jgi:flagellar hook-associated protein 2
MGTSSIFTGSSRYSNDFQAAITRATQIASMPMTQLQGQQAGLTSQGAELTNLGSLFSKLQSAVGGIANSLGGSSLQTTVSDTSKLSVTLGDGAITGNYSVEVVDPGAYATSLSASTWTADTGPTHTYQLSIGDQQYTVNAADNSAASVAAAINAQYSDKVSATVVNLGSTSTPDYRISLQAVALGDLKPDLLDNSVSRQRQQTLGVQAHYIVDSSGVDAYSSSQSVTIATGVTVNLKASGVGTPVNIAVTRSASAVSSALQGFASAYNAAVDELNNQHGESGSVLAGQSIVGELSQVLSQIATYSVPGDRVGSLAGLGLDLDKNGHLTFNSANFTAAGLSSISSFLGSAGTQGFLKAASDGLNGVQDAATGLLPTAQADIQSQTTNLTDQIADQQARIDSLTARLQAQMSAADALVASMEQQYTYLSGMFSAMQTADQQYK